MAIQAFPIMLKVFCVLFLAVFIDLVTLINSFFFFFQCCSCPCVCVWERQRETEKDRNRGKQFKTILQWVVPKLLLILPPFLISLFSVFHSLINLFPYLGIQYPSFFFLTSVASLSCSKSLLQSLVGVCPRSNMLEYKLWHHIESPGGHPMLNS